MGYSPSLLLVCLSGSPPHPLTPSPRPSVSMQMLMWALKGCSASRSSLVLENIFVQIRRRCFTNWSQTQVFPITHTHTLKGWNIWRMSAIDFSGQSWLGWCLQLHCWDYVLWSPRLWGWSNRTVRVNNRLCICVEKSLRRQDSTLIPSNQPTRAWLKITFH